VQAQETFANTRVECWVIPEPLVGLGLFKPEIQDILNPGISRMISDGRALQRLAPRYISPVAEVNTPLYGEQWSAQAEVDGKTVPRHGTFADVLRDKKILIDSWNRAAESSPSAATGSTAPPTPSTNK
jgi:hypothetical protein